jgi:hypothetical protein
VAHQVEAQTAIERIIGTAMSALGAVLVVAEVAGFRIPPEAKFLIVQQDKIGREHKFSSLKLTTLLAIFKYQTFDQALDMVRQI